MKTNICQSFLCLSNIFHNLIQTPQDECGTIPLLLVCTKSMEVCRGQVASPKSSAESCSSHRQEPGFLARPEHFAWCMCLIIACHKLPEPTWKTTWVPVDLAFVFQAATATVSSAKVPTSAHAVKSHFSSSTPNVSKNVGKDTLQIMQHTNVQVMWVFAECFGKNSGQPAGHVD